MGGCQSRSKTDKAIVKADKNTTKVHKKEDEKAAQPILKKYVDFLLNLVLFSTI